MSNSRILLVGNCSADNYALERFLQAIFSADVFKASTSMDATTVLADNSFDLVLVNRIFDRTGESGLDFIRQTLEKHPNYSCMLISNYDDAQQSAVELGGKLGFGKSKLFDSETIQRIRTALDCDAKC